VKTTKGYGKMPKIHPSGETWVGKSGSQGKDDEGKKGGNPKKVGHGHLRKSGIEDGHLGVQTHFHRRVTSGAPSGQVTEIHRHGLKLEITKPGGHGKEWGELEGAKQSLPTGHPGHGGGELS